jgi:predicted O-linked N-acetylglucosamine transferase (SPINDLY family)
VTTACDALGAGLRVLTLKGATFVSRAGESLLRAAFTEMWRRRQAGVKGNSSAHGPVRYA